MIPRLTSKRRAASQGGAYEYPRDGLVAEWLFSGNANDTSGAGNNLTVSGATLTTDQQGTSSEAYLFNDDNDYLYKALAGFRSGDNVGSISFWFKTSNPAANLNILSFQDLGDNNNFSMIRIDAGSVEIYSDTAVTPYSQIKTTDNSYDDDAWHLGLVVSDGSAYTIYVDGYSEALTVVNGANEGQWFGDIPSLDNICVGFRRRNAGDINWFDGKLNDILIWNRELDATEALNMWNGTR